MTSSCAVWRWGRRPGAGRWQSHILLRIFGVAGCGGDRRCVLAGVLNTIYIVPNLWSAWRQPGGAGLFVVGNPVVVGAILATTGVLARATLLDHSAVVVFSPHLQPWPLRDCRRGS